MEQSLPPDVEELLQDLQPEQLFTAVRKKAAQRLGELSVSDPRVVKALIAAMESDSAFIVRKEAAAALRAPAHQEILQQHPDLRQKMLEIEVAPRATPSAEQQVADEIPGMPEPPMVSEIGWDEIAKVSSVPVTRWRLALAAVYGLVAALASGYLWYLLTTTTGKKYGYAALGLGLAVGVVVNFMSGGNKDRRYAVLGAILAGVGIAFGEFLIFGLTDSAFVYKFESVDLVIYAFAVYEGWVMPQRSIALIKGMNHLIKEHNWKPVLVVGVVALILLLGFVMLAQQDLPDLSGAVLTSQDFPYDFLEPAPDQFGLEVGEPIEEGLVIESAFILLSLEPFEMIYGFTVLLPNKSERASFDREMRQADAMLESIVEGVATEGDDILEQGVLSDLEVIGDASAGFTVVMDSEDGAFRMDMLGFRRDVAGAAVYILYLDGEVPIVPVEVAARKLDDRIVETLSAND